MNEYDRCYYDALKQVYENTGRNNYKLYIKDKILTLYKNTNLD